MAPERPWRLFVAVPLPRSIADELARRLAPIRAECPGARWVRPELLHLTVLFLGETDPSSVPAITDAMEATAGAGQPFTIALDAAGSFPGGARRGTVVWLDGARGRDELLTLTRQLRARLDRRADRPDAVHLTIARDAPAGLVARLVAVVHPPLAWDVDAIHLYRSHLGSGPPRYEELARVALPTGAAQEWSAPEGDQAR